VQTHSQPHILHSVEKDTGLSTPPSRKSSPVFEMCRLMTRSTVPIYVDILGEDLSELSDAASNVFYRRIEQEVEVPEHQELNVGAREHSLQLHQLVGDSCRVLHQSW
jgi:hypothetical protein